VSPSDRRVTARARFGSLSAMKRNKTLLPCHLKGFQPLHFTWHPWPDLKS
jgi:hypothetical protein